MTSELHAAYPTGSTLYAVLQNVNGQAYNGTTFETPAAAN